MPLFARASNALIALFLACAVTLGVAAQAQDRDPVYDAMVAALHEATDKEASLQATLGSIRSSYARDPAVAGADFEKPGFLDDLMVEIEPILRNRSARLEVILSNRLADLFARNVTPDQAKQMTGFFKTDAYKRFSMKVTRAYSPDNQIALRDPGTPVTDAQVRADAEKASSDAMAATTDEELDELDQLPGMRLATSTLDKLGPQMASIRADIENIPLSAEEATALNAAINNTFKKYYEQPPK